MKLFAALREQRGAREVELELAEGARVEAVWPALGLGDEPAGLVYAVNRSYADRNAPLAEGDEVALIPPVSGGAFRLSDEPLSLPAPSRISSAQGPLGTKSGKSQSPRFDRQ